MILLGMSKNKLKILKPWKAWCYGSIKDDEKVVYLVKI